VWPSSPEGGVGDGRVGERIARDGIGEQLKEKQEK